MITNINFCDSWMLLGGMPAVRLSGEASTRMQGISFFVMGIVIATLAVWWSWNWLRRDFAVLPKLSLLGAAGLTVLWGMLFIIVLTMISGARELMTPKAWRPDGLTYALNEEPEEVVRDELDYENEIKLVAATLKHYQRTRGGEPPENIFYLSEAAEELGFVSLGQSLEMNYWYDPPSENGSPLLLRQLAPTKQPAWGITDDGEIIRLDQAEKTEMPKPGSVRNTRPADYP
ncbi:hypothetical protein [Blastopirellula marina]|uniref:Uncharacterized protein n=1 Tax=Blastopirellula marina TaxID=124 RepID=A0A2S8GI10_9BACT|nr:hypothetical protein [Blastopirellula marina]PQO44076.1 hypothetical protein C5Y93_21300 [Blastopirellula marina]